MSAPTITVRLVQDTRDAEFWFEEKLDSGYWARMPETIRSCEANSRHALEQELERRRQARLAICRKIGKEETIPL